MVDGRRGERAVARTEGVCALPGLRCRCVPEISPYGAERAASGVSGWVCKEDLAIPHRVARNGAQIHPLGVPIDSGSRTPLSTPSPQAGRGGPECLSIKLTNPLNQL